MRLRRSNLAGAGISRRRTGKASFRYFDESRNPIIDQAVLSRLSALAIPPAWSHVWICPRPNGHIQASGTDAAGRRQYLYHPDWRKQREAAKHRRMMEFATRLPAARRQWSADLRGAELTSSRVMAGVLRLLDTGSLRIGTETYATEHGTYGIATLLRRHVTVDGSRVCFSYTGKANLAQHHVFADAALARLVSQLLERADRGTELFAWWTPRGWHDVTSSDINAQVRTALRGEFTAKDFRTWNATVLMSQELAMRPTPTSERHRKQDISAAFGAVAAYLGNTPAIARTSYVNPRVVDLYRAGVVIPASSLPGNNRHLPIHGKTERAVRKMLLD